MGRRLHAAAPVRGRPALAADRAQDPLRRQAPLLRDPRLRRSRPRSTATRAGATTSRYAVRHRRGLLRQLQRQAHRLRVRPDRGRQQDRPDPRQRRDGVGHELGRRLGRQGRPRRRRAGRRSSGSRSTSCATGRRRSRSGACTPGAGSPATRRRASGSSSRARTPGACTSSASCTGSAGCRRSRHLELLPHVVGQDELGAVRRRTTAPTLAGALGLDAKVGLTTNFTLDATVNPDFGQVEADPSVVNLTAYETFFEEKRPFFLEGRKILSFDARGPGPALLLAPHRPGAVATCRSPARARPPQMPESTTILAALKVTGKTADGLSVGVLQSFTQKETRGRLLAGRRPRAGRRALQQLHGRARLQKDWDKGNTMPRRDAHVDPPLDRRPRARVPADPGVHGGRRLLALLRGTAPGVLDGERRPRATSQGSPEAIRALQTNPVHYYQRPDAEHLGVDASARSLSGHGGVAPLRPSGKGRLAARRSAPLVLARPRPQRHRLPAPGRRRRERGCSSAGRSLRRRASLPRVLLPALARGRVGLRRARDERSATRARGLGAVPATSGGPRRASLSRARRHARAARRPCAPLASDYYETSLEWRSDPSRRASLSLRGERDWAREGGLARRGTSRAA